MVTATPAPVVTAPAAVVVPPPPAPQPTAEPAPPMPAPAPVRPSPVIDTTPKAADATAPAVKSETDPTVAAEQALARRERSVSGTVLTSWRGVLQPAASGSAAPVRKRLLGE